MRKNALLVAVAAAALAVGSGAAFSQAPQAGQKSEKPAAAQSSPASKNAPAEKMKGAEQKGSVQNRIGEANKSRSETTGLGACARGQKMGQENKNLNQKMGQEKNELNKSKSTTGQAPSERSKAGQANERRENNKVEGQKNLNNKSTTGQAPSQQTSPKSDRMNNANEPNRANERTGAGENRTGPSTSTSTSTSTPGSVNLSSEQRTKIHSIIVSEHNAPRVAHVDFDVRVGTVVPRGKVKFVPLPSTIVEIEPQWRGYEYFLVGDEIVVVDPATLRIVAVLPA